MLIAELPMSFGNIQGPVFAVGILTLCLLITWNKISHPLIKKVPRPLMAVIFSAGLAVWLNLNGTTLLQVPADIRSLIVFPDYSFMSTFDGWRSAAIDKTDPLKRKSNLNRDLVSKGFCNVLSAMLGGIPMIAEIVRSSANVTYGAKSWKANFSHGLIILLAVLVLPKALAYIPLSALAIDLLVGIFCEAVAPFAIEIYLGLKLKHTLKASYEIKSNPESTELIVYSSLAFSNFLGLKEDIIRHAHFRKEFKLDFSK